MVTLETLPRMYEDLANHFVRQGESRRRDECLVLAADAALSAGMPEEAERLRKRLLLTNPNHLLRAYGSMAEAIQSRDVCDYVVGLRREWPPEKVEKLLRPGSVPLAAVPRSTPRTTASASMPSDEVPAGSFWLNMLILAAGVMVAIGVLVVAFGPASW